MVTCLHGIQVKLLLCLIVSTKYKNIISFSVQSTSYKILYYYYFFCSPHLTNDKTFTTTIICINVAFGSATNFNGDLSKWDTSKVTTLSGSKYKIQKYHLFFSTKHVLQNIILLLFFFVPLILQTTNIYNNNHLY